VAPGQPIELSWLTHNVAGLSLTADGVEYLPDGAPSGPGSLTIPSIGKITTFVLRATNAIGLTAEESLTVETWRLSLDVTPSATEIRPGEELRIDIDAKALDGGSAPVVFGTLPMVERTEPELAYVDLSTLVGKELALGKGETHTVVPIAFPEGFTFPYFGEEHRSLWALTDGLVSFHPTAINYVSLNRPFPDASSTYSVVHLAPFWDDLHPQMVGEVWSGLIDPDTLVIQWKNMSMSIGSTDTATHDLNFNLVLHRSGAFEYCYGTMNGLTPPATDISCVPNTCANEAAGAAATIGYQNIGGTTGMNLHFGGVLPKASNRPFAGGLSNRTFRYEPVVGSKQVILTPQESGTYVFCSPSGANLLCDSFEVRADLAIESFTAADPQIAFGARTSLSWKTVGGRKLTILEGSSIVHTTEDLAAIDAGTARTPPSSRKRGRPLSSIRRSPLLRSPSS